MLEIQVLSDEEFEEYQKSKKRKAILSELESMTSPSKKPSGNRSFSVKDFKSKPKTEDPNMDYGSMITDGDHHQVRITDDWETFMSNVTDANVSFTPSPIDDTTDREIFSSFKLDSEVTEGGKFDSVFKKELGMLSEVLKEVKAHGVTIKNQLAQMIKPSKGSGRASGVTKNFADLVEAYNSINVTKVNIIKEMANLRGKQVDWTLKDKKDNPEVQENIDGIADQFYKSIMNGNSSQFIRQGTSGVTLKQDFEYNPLYDDQASNVTNDTYNTGDSSELDSMSMKMGFNPTQPLNGISTQYNDDIEADPYGYIAQEHNSFEICVYEYGDGSYQFAAVDKDGNVIDGVELPSDEDPDIINNLSLRPGSDFVYDKMGRKYRIIQMGPVDTSDIDDMPYPY